MKEDRHISIDNCEKIRKLRAAGVEIQIIADAFEASNPTIYYHSRGDCTHPVDVPPPTISRTNEQETTTSSEIHIEKSEFSEPYFEQTQENDLIPIRDDWRLVCKECEHMDEDAYVIGPCPNCGSAKTASEPSV